MRDPMVSAGGVNTTIIRVRFYWTPSAATPSSSEFIISVIGDVVGDDLVDQLGLEQLGALDLRANLISGFGGRRSQVA